MVAYPSPVTTAARRLEYLPVRWLTEHPHPDNPKAHDLPAITASLTQFGYADTVLLDERTECLISGHGRVEALAALEAAGGPPPDGVKVVKGEWRIPVTRGWSSRDDDEARAYLLAANRIGERAGWEPEPLANLLRDLHGSVPMLVELAGWTDDERLAAYTAAWGSENPFDGDGGQGPGEFPGVGDEDDTDFRCPSCGHEWNGKPRP